MDYDANNWRFIVRCIVQLRIIHAATSWKSGSEIYFSLAIFYSGHCRIYQQRKYINICPWWTRVFDVLWKLTARASRGKQFTGGYITVKLSFKRFYYSHLSLTLCSLSQQLSSARSGPNAPRARRGKMLTNR